MTASAAFSSLPFILTPQLEETNMRNKHGCVWLDHCEAKIFGISEDDVEEVDVKDTFSPARIHRLGVTSVYASRPSDCSPLFAS